LLLETNNTEQLLERIKKGSDYYKNFLQKEMGILLLHMEEMRQKKRVKTYLNSLSDLDQLFCKKLEEVDKALYLTESILEGKYQFDFSSLRDQRALTRARILEEVRSKVGPPTDQKKKGKGRKKKKNEPSTYDITLRLLEAGMTVEEIARERELVTSTIEGHLAKAVEEQRVSVYKFMTREQVTAIENALKEMPEEFTSKDLFTALEGKFNYGQLRAVMSHVRSTNIRSTDQDKID
jgi:hypothetical protein